MINISDFIEGRKEQGERKDAFTIAVAGKGGTGKTTLAGLIIRVLVERELGSVLAVDADPNANLNQLLGFEIQGTIGELEAEVLEDDGEIPPGMTKKRWMEYNLQQILAEGKGKDLLVMGRGEGPSCYCAINNILREYMDNLSRNYDFVVMDNEAGMEHLSRRTTSGVDTLLVASSENPVAIKSAGRISELVQDLGIRVEKTYLVLNGISGEISERTEKQIDKLDLELLAEIPRDENILELCQKEKPLKRLSDESPSLVEVNKLVEKILPSSTKTPTANRS